MTKQELYLKTMFCCMACDLDIAEEEITLIKETIANEAQLFEGLEVEELLNVYVSEINEAGKLFLTRYLSALAEAELTQEEDMTVVDLAIKMIEADNVIQYSEVSFFKKIRVRLSLSDEQILEKHPDKEDFLLPDINVYEDPIWDNVVFENIILSEKVESE